MKSLLSAEVSTQHVLRLSMHLSRWHAIMLPLFSEDDQLNTLQSDNFKQMPHKQILGS